MRNPTISLAVLAALLLAAPAAPAEDRSLAPEYPPPRPEFLLDEAFVWGGNVSLRPNRAGVWSGLRRPYIDTYGDYNVHLGCSQIPYDYWFVDFEFPRRRSLRALHRALRGARPNTGDPIQDGLGRRDVIQPVRVGLWSRVHEGKRPAEGGEGYLLRHDVEIYERSIRNWAHIRPEWNEIGIEGGAARELIRKIQRADSIAWTDVETAATSPAMPITDEMRTFIGRVMEACGISHEPPPSTPTAAPDRPALRP